MKKIVIFLIICCFGSLFAQESTSNHFFIDGKKIPRPIKYISYDSKMDEKKVENEKICFYIKGETFVFLKNRSKLDTCNIESLKKIKIEKVEELSNKEYLFYKQKVKEQDKWEEKMLGPMPITKNHNYFKIIVVEEFKNKILKYETEWPYTGITGFQVRE